MREEERPARGHGGTNRAFFSSAPRRAPPCSAIAARRRNSRRRPVSSSSLPRKRECGRDVGRTGVGPFLPRSLGQAPDAHGAEIRGGRCWSARLCRAACCGTGYERILLGQPGVTLLFVQPSRWQPRCDGTAIRAPSKVLLSPLELCPFRDGDRCPVGASVVRRAHAVSAGQGEHCPGV